MTDQPGWASPSEGGRDRDGRGTPPPAPTPSSTWASQQPPPYQGWGPPPAPPPPPGQPGWGPPPGQPGWGPPPGQPGWGPQAWAPPPKPGVIPLRPLGVGEILDGAISTIRSRPRVMLGLSALVAVASQLVIAPLTYLLLRDTSSLSFSGEPASSEESVTYQANAFGAAAIQGIVTLLATLVLTGILTVVLSRAVLGRSSDAGEAWRQARPRLPALLGVTLLVGLLELVVLAVLLAPGIVLAVADAPVLLTVLAFVVGVPAAVALGVYLYVAFALAPPAIVLERQGVVAGMRRSRALVKGAWWRTFGILVLVNVIAYLFSLILSIPFTVLSLVAAFASGSGDELDLYAALPLTVTTVGTIVASTITWPFTAVSTGLLYVDRRMRREALDLELARAAGLAPAGQSATPGTSGAVGQGYPPGAGAPPYRP